MFTHVTIFFCFSNYSWIQSSLLYVILIICAPISSHPHNSTADVQVPPVFSFGLLFPTRKGSGGHLLHVSWQYSTCLRGYRAPSIRLWLEHGPLLPEGNPPNQRVDSLRRCDGERKEESLEGRRQRQGWVGEKYSKLLCFLDMVGPTPCIVL